MFTNNRYICFGLDCFSAVQTHVISRDEMEPNNSVTEENKDAKPPAENEPVTVTSAPNSEEVAKEEVKETEATPEPSATTLKRTLEGEEEDDDMKKKRRKGFRNLPRNSLCNKF